MRSRIRLVSTLVLFAPVIAAACGGDDDAGAKGSGAAAGTGESGRGGSGQAQAGAGGSAGANVGGADSCARAGGSNAVIEPLGNDCGGFQCPASIADAAEETLNSCTNTFPPRITFGCGTVTVDYSDFSGGIAYTFDSVTKKVIGIASSNDTPTGECHANEYLYGSFGPSCPEAVTCYPCDDLRNDAKNSAAGAAGAAGDLGFAGAAGAAGDSGSSGAGGDGFVPSPPHCPKF